MYAKANREGTMAGRRNILLCTDGGLHSDYAFKYYRDNVHKEGDFLVMLFCPKIDLPPEEITKDDGGTKELGQHLLHQGERVLKESNVIEKKLKDNGIDGTVILASVAIPPKESIVEASVTQKADLIILGARRLGKGLRELGTTKQYVVRRSEVPVLICKHGTASKTRTGFKRLVVGGSDCTMYSSEGLKYYRDHIYKEGDFMLLTYVPEPRPATAGGKNKLKAITSGDAPQLQGELQKLYVDNASLLKDFLKDDLKMPGEVIIGLPGSNPGDALLEVAESEGANLIVVGARGLSEQEFEAGTRTSEKVANDSQVTVLVYKF